MNSFSFSVPQNIIVEKGGLAKLPEVAKELGGTKAFIISGPHLNKMGIVGKCIEALEAKGIKATAYTDTEGNPWKYNGLRGRRKSSRRYNSVNSCSDYSRNRFRSNSIFGYNGS